MKYFISLFLCMFVGSPASAEVRVLTTTSTLRSVADIVGGGRIKSDSIAKGSQDPHYVEAKPSYMVKARDADLLIASGLDLEIGWLPNVLQGARNPKIQKSAVGYLELGKSISPLDVPSGKVDRSQGDIHPYGNPHFQTDPVRMGEAALLIAKKLGEIDPVNAAFYKTNAEAWRANLAKKTQDWKERVQRSSVKRIMTHHRTLTYFLNRFGVESAGEIEDKPGIPPTANHLLSLIRLVKEQKVPCILVESFFETAPAERIRKDAPLKIIVVPSEVDAMEGVATYEDMVERLVGAVESCGKK